MAAAHLRASSAAKDLLHVQHAQLCEGTLLGIVHLSAGRSKCMRRHRHMSQQLSTLEKLSPKTTASMDWQLALRSVALKTWCHADTT